MSEPFHSKNTVPVLEEQDKSSDIEQQPTANKVITLSQMKGVTQPIGAS